VKIDPSANSSRALATGNGVQRSPQGETGAAAPQASGTSAAQTTSSADTTDGVSLSPLAAQLRGIGASSNGDIDVHQVAQIKQAIANGTLTIDPSKIAAGLLDTVRGLLSNKQ
jgi:negative regulator of flagellin synthesis FlgM